MVSVSSWMKQVYFQRVGSLALKWLENVVLLDQALKFVGNLLVDAPHTSRLSVRQWLLRLGGDDFLKHAKVFERESLFLADHLQVSQWSFEKRQKRRSDGWALVLSTFLWAEEDGSGVYTFNSSSTDGWVMCGFWNILILGMWMCVYAGNWLALRDFYAFQAF